MHTAVGVIPVGTFRIWAMNITMPWSISTRAEGQEQMLVIYKTITTSSKTQSRFPLLLILWRELFPILPSDGCRSKLVRLPRWEALEAIWASRLAWDRVRRSVYDCIAIQLLLPRKFWKNSMVCML